MNPPLVGITRPTTGADRRLLEDAGCDVVHVPLIEITPPDDPDKLDDALDQLERFDWVVVTSSHGADRVARAVASHRHLRLAAVGPQTAARLAHLTGRAVDVVPERSTGLDLCAAMPQPDGTATVLVAQADRATAEVADALSNRGYQPTTVTAYSTRLRIPTASEQAALAAVDALLLASGSAAISWRETFGTDLPPITVTIGRRTAMVAEELGLQVTHIAADHSATGLAQAAIEALRYHRNTTNAPSPPPRSSTSSPSTSPVASRPDPINDDPAIDPHR